MWLSFIFKFMQKIRFGGFACSLGSSFLWQLLQRITEAAHSVCVLKCVFCGACLHFKWLPWLTISLPVSSHFVFDVFAVFSPHYYFSFCSSREISSHKLTFFSISPSQVEALIKFSPSQSWVMWVIFDSYLRVLGGFFMPCHSSSWGCQGGNNFPLDSKASVFSETKLKVPLCCTDAVAVLHLFSCSVFGRLKVEKSHFYCC